MINLEWPWMFYLLPLPLLVYFLLPAVKQDQAALFMPLLGQYEGSQSSPLPARSSIVSLVLLSLIWLCLILACARPVKMGEAIELPASGRDLLLAVDISGSMKQEDMALNNRAVDRLTLVKHVVNTFIEQRQGDRLGLILFGSQAFIQAPLTFDLATVGQLLNEAQIGFAGNETAIGDAIGLAIKRLANNPADSRILILLTDGQNTAGSVDPLQAAQLAKQEQVVIYTIGIGSDQVQSRGPFGLFGNYNPSRDLDEQSLKQIASITGGEYFRARNQQELDGIYHTIDTLEPIEQDKEVFRPQQSFSHWPLMAMLVLTLLLAGYKRYGAGR